MRPPSCRYGTSGPRERVLVGRQLRAARDQHGDVTERRGARPSAVAMNARSRRCAIVDAMAFASASREFGRVVFFAFSGTMHSITADAVSARVRVLGPCGQRHVLRLHAGRSVDQRAEDAFTQSMIGPAERKFWTIRRTSPPKMCAFTSSYMAMSARRKR